MPDSATPFATADGPDSEPSPLRTILSLVIFIHFFGVGLALLSYTAASPIEQRVLEILPYLKVLDIDPIHSYPSLARLHLTHSQPSDVDFTVDVTAALADGTTQTVTIPPTGVRPGQRLRRYQSLANVMGSLVENEDLESLLPKAIAGSILRQAGSTRGTIQIISHDLPSMEDLASSRPERRDPNNAVYSRRVYGAQVLLGKDTVNLLKTSAAGEVAPVERPKNRSAAGKAARPDPSRSEGAPKGVGPTDNGPTGGSRTEEAKP